VGLVGEGKGNEATFLLEAAKRLLGELVLVWNDMWMNDCRQFTLGSERDLLFDTRTNGKGKFTIEARVPWKSHVENCVCRGTKCVHGKGREVRSGSRDFWVGAPSVPPVFPVAKVTTQSRRALATPSNASRDSEPAFVHRPLTGQTNRRSQISFGRPYGFVTRSKYNYR
jgi:hypothetical protein